MALWNASKQQGMGFIHARGSDMAPPMSREEAEREIEAARQTRTDGTVSIYFDYLHGRILKSEISGDTYSPHLYDRDNGEGAAARALAPLLEAAP